MENKLKRYKQREMYTQNNGRFTAVWSYATLIGYIDTQTNTFYTWGYRRYSRTTSRQITQLIREQNLRLVQKDEQTIRQLIKDMEENL